MLVMRNAADLRIQAQKRRVELKNKEAPSTTQNGEANGSAEGSMAMVATISGSSGIGSRGSMELGNSMVIPSSVEN